MSDRYTASDVRHAFGNLIAATGWRSDARQRTPAWDGSLFLEERAPGDGVTRYRVMAGSGSSGNSHGPFGDLYWLGAREATVALQAATRAVSAFKCERGL